MNYSSINVERAVASLDRALKFDVPEYRRSFQAPGLVILNFTKTKCPALTEINRQLAHFKWMKEQEEYRVMSRKIWMMREARLSDLLTVAEEDPRTTKQEKEKMNRLWYKAMNLAYPVGHSESDENYEPGYC